MTFLRYRKFPNIFNQVRCKLFVPFCFSLYNILKLPPVRGGSSKRFRQRLSFSEFSKKLFEQGNGSIELFITVVVVRRETQDGIHPVFSHVDHRVPPE